MPIFIKRILGLVIVLVLLVGMNAFMSREGLFGFGLPYYYAEIINLTGISIILATSLNLITGFTGQFSIGHAGFMAVGAYSSVFMTVYFSAGLEQWLTGLVGATLAQSIVFLAVIIFGALVAALAGLVVGIPSLRFRGDYSHQHSQHRSSRWRHGLSWPRSPLGRSAHHSAVRKLHLDWRLRSPHDRRRLQHRQVRHWPCVNLDSRR